MGGRSGGLKPIRYLSAGSKLGFALWFGYMHIHYRIQASQAFPGIFTCLVAVKDEGFLPSAQLSSFHQVRSSFSHSAAMSHMLGGPLVPPVRWDAFAPPSLPSSCFIKQIIVTLHLCRWQSNNQFLSL